MVLRLKNIGGPFEVLQLFYRTKVFISRPTQDGDQREYCMTQLGVYI